MISGAGGVADSVRADQPNRPHLRRTRFQTGRAQTSFPPFHWFALMSLMRPKTAHHLRKLLLPGGLANPSAGWSRSWRVLGLGALLLVATGGLVRGADSPGIRYAPPEAWVTTHFVRQPAVADGEAGADERTQLWEQQINVSSNATFFHSIRQIRTTAGLQKGSTITIDFNPGYETLTWHWARIWRDGQHLDRLDTNQVKIVQREQDLDDYLLNGRKSAVLVLDDVRVGDSIDFSYTRKGLNPIYAGHFAAEVPVQTEQPADRLLTRLLWPKNRALFAQTHGCTVQPAVVAGTNGTEYVWDLNRMPGLTPEDSLPGWYDPEQWVQLTDFGSWAAVDRWALSLFPPAPALSPALTQKIKEWQQLPDAEPQVLAALRFVQDQVRYFGIEVGASTVKPADPATVFARRYGDCKDKSWLLVSVLRTLGVEAYPVLVNSTVGRGLDNWRPTANAFDHCIVVAVLNGQSYWLDPTMTYQRGPLALNYLPPYERGLVVAPRTTALAVIPPPADFSQTAVTEYFQLGHQGMPSSLTVVTVAKGHEADRRREFFTTTKRAEIEKNYTHFYADQYPGIRMTTPLALQDDLAPNVFQTTETYEFDDVWKRSAKDNKYQCEFYPTSLAGLFAKPEDTDRTMPLGLRYPRHMFLRTEVTVPDPVQASTAQKTITDGSFRFHKDFQGAGNRLVIQYEYQALADSVAPEAMADYLEHMDESAKLLGNTFVWQ